MAKIGVDIGHGRNTFPPSKGVNKNGKGYHEHDANSRVAESLTKKLKAAGHTVFQAQKAGAVDVPLTTRTNQYRSQGVDLIVSCHANAGDPSAKGYASFYWHSDSKAKKLSDLYADEIKKQGFSLWGGSRPSLASGWSNFHMCRVPANAGIPSILLENGFMTNSGDFEWIFGNKRDEYAEKCATAAFNAIQRFLGGKTATAQPTKVASNTTTSKTTSKTSSSDIKAAQKWANQYKEEAKFSKLAEDGINGPKTMDALLRIAQYFGKTGIDGRWGPKTKASVSTQSMSVHQAGWTRLVQATLVCLGYNIGSSGIDGKFGNDTRKAVAAYQRSKGITADGIAGPNTFEKFFKTA